MGFIKPFPTKNAEGEHGHSHSGIKGDLQRKTRCGRRVHTKMGAARGELFSWVKPATKKG